MLTKCENEYVAIKIPIDGYKKTGVKVPVFLIIFYSILEFISYRNS